MHSQLGPLYELFKLNTRMYGNGLDGIDGETAKKRLSSETNSIAFVACHLLDARCYLARYMGCEVTNPFAELFARADSIDQLDEVPKIEELVRVWVNVSDELDSRFGEVTEEFLSAESSQDFPVDDGSVLGGIAFLISHESYHIGQLGMMRKFLGFSSMRYS